MALKALLLRKELDGKRSALTKADRKEEFEKRTAELEAAVNEITEDNTAEEREALTNSIEELEADKAENEAAITKLREEIAELEKELAEIEEEQNVPAQPEERTKDMSEIMTRNSVEYVNAYAEYIKGRKDERELRNMLTTENDTTPNGTATVAVPDVVYDTIKTAWNREELMALVPKTYIRGNLRIGFEISATDAVVHAEGAAAISPEDLVLGIVELKPESIKKVIQVSDEALDMGGEDFLRYLYDELTYRIAKKAASELIADIAGAGTTSTASVPGQAKVTVSALALGDIAQAIGNLADDASNPVVVMNKLTWAAYKSVQYANGYNVDPFEGLRVVFSSDLPAFGTATTGNTFAIVGDFGRGAQANFPNGSELEIKVDRLTLKKQDLVEILGRKYVAVGATAPYHFTRLAKG